MKKTVSVFLALCLSLLLLPAACAEGAGPDDSPAWVAALPKAEGAQQLLVVAGIGVTTANVSLHERDENGSWKRLMTTPGYIGKNGLGKTREGDAKTPVGVYGFNRAFGVAPDPGCRLPYTQVTEELYWSGDTREGYHYNELVSLREYPDLSLADSEHLADYALEYQYCLNISYNAEGIPGLGSAIFLHCLGEFLPYTGGCVAIPAERMLAVMRAVRPDCVVVIDSLENLSPETWEALGLGSTEELRLDFGVSALYSLSERADASAVILKSFAGRMGCRLHTLRYAGDRSCTEENLRWLNAHEGGGAYTACCEFVSDFRSPVEACGAWEPNVEYTDWSWWLARSENGAWVLVDCGH